MPSRARPTRFDRRQVLDEHFPLYVWQTGSGTQSNMKRQRGVVEPRDPVARRQDRQQVTDPSQRRRQHGAVVERHVPDGDAYRRRAGDFEEHLLPAAEALAESIDAKAEEWSDVVKTGRTHLQDAVPLTGGQEWSGYVAADPRRAGAPSGVSEDGLFQTGGRTGPRSAPGLNAPAGFSREIASKVAELTGHPFVTAPNKFAAQGSLDGMVAAMAALRGLAVALMKIANDMRWLASGPRCGLGELVLPENEPGSSIMPGKVNLPSARRW